MAEHSRHRRRTKWLIVVLAVLLVSGGCGYAYFIYSEHSSLEAGGEDRRGYTAQDRESERPAAARAARYASEGEYQKAIDTYEATIMAADQDASTTAVDYILLGSALWSNGDAPITWRQRAIDYTLKAEQLAPTLQSAAQLEEYYRVVGDTVNADLYGARVAERMPQAYEGNE